MSSHPSSQPLRPRPAPADKSRPRVVHPPSSASLGREPVAAPAPRELWLALHLPRVMLDALGGSIAALRASPIATNAAPSQTHVETPPPAQSEGLAVLDLEGGGKVVWACDAVAVPAGVVPGRALNSSQVGHGLDFVGQFSRNGPKPGRQKRDYVPVSRLASCLANAA